MLRFVRFKLAVKCQISSRETCEQFHSGCCPGWRAGPQATAKPDVKHQPSGCIPNTQCKKTWGCPRKQTKKPHLPTTIREGSQNHFTFTSVGMYFMMSRRKTRRGCFWRWSQMKLWRKAQRKMALRDSRLAQNGMRRLHNSSFIGFYKTTWHQWDHKTQPSS